MISYDFVNWLLNWLLHPYLWMLPFLSLLVLNLYQIAKVGLFQARIPKIDYMKSRKGKNPPNSINVVTWCIMALTSLICLNTLSNQLRVYLTFSVLFGAYGTGELFNKLLAVIEESRKNGFWTWLMTTGYPLFFFMHNIPLFIFLSDRFQVAWNLFLPLMILQLLAYVILRFQYYLYPNQPRDRRNCLLAYYMARTSAVLGYITVLIQ